MLYRNVNKLLRKKQSIKYEIVEAEFIVLPDKFVTIIIFNYYVNKNLGD